MIPLGDNVASRRRPVVTLGIIVACCVVFLYELTLRGTALDAFVQRWGAVPRVVIGALSLDPRVPRQEALTLFTSQFIHAGLLHLGGNMLFLWVFGRAVEDRVGSPIFLVFFLLAGAVAGLVQSVIAADNLPLIGASGAIAGVLGIYFIAYPTAWVRVLLPVLFFFWTFDLPAVLVLAFWFVTQAFSGIAAITRASSATGDIAVWAHIAGFIVGVACARILPHPSGFLPVGAGPPALRREDAPGPARLVSSLADLAAVLLAARLALRFFGQLDAPRPPIALIAGPVQAVTQPVVGPFQALLPTVRVFGGALETNTLVVIVTVYVIAGLVGQLFVQRKQPAVRAARQR